MGDYLRCELETVINFNDEDKTATVYTRQRPIMRKLDSMCERFPEEYKLLKRTEIDATYELPKKYVTFRGPRVISDEQKEAMTNRLAEINSARFPSHN